MLDIATLDSRRLRLYTPLLGWAGRVVARTRLLRCHDFAKPVLVVSRATTVTRVAATCDEKQARHNNAENVEPPHGREARTVASP